ncbi:MAG: cobalamin biosynthesis protein [Mesorhizobium sp.]|nr:cobalamin biosynthesis protein [Mesorhizobium sp.]
MIVAGVGCKSGVSTESVVEAIEAALAAVGMEPAALAALATVPEKAREAAIADAAHRLDVGLVVADETALAEAAQRCMTDSARSFEATGTPSAAEAAALAAAGPQSWLLGPRLVLGPVTCALAVTGDLP